MNNKLKTYLVMTTSNELEIEAESFSLDDNGISFWINGTGMIAFVSYNALSSIVTKVTKKDE